MVSSDADATQRTAGTTTGAAATDCPKSIAAAATVAAANPSVPTTAAAAAAAAGGLREVCLRTVALTQGRSVAPLTQRSVGHVQLTGGAQRGQAPGEDGRGIRRGAGKGAGEVVCMGGARGG